jgi:hypothetical protein
MLRPCRKDASRAFHVASCFQEKGLPAIPSGRGGSGTGMESSAKRKMEARTIPTDIFLRFVGGNAVYAPFPKRLLAFLPFDLFDLKGMGLFLRRI